MIKVIYGTTLNKDEALVHPDTTVRNFLEEKDINYETAAPFLDGRPLGTGDLDKSFADLGIKEKCRITSVVKAVNA